MAAAPPASATSPSSAAASSAWRWRASCTRGVPRRALAVLERGAEVGTGQTGANSGVIHAGIYYAPGSLKARLCVAGARAMYAYCEEHGIAHERCGKLIVARDECELGRLDELERRGRENGVPGLRRLAARGDRRDRAARPRAPPRFTRPRPGIVDFAAVARSLAAEPRATTARRWSRAARSKASISAAGASSCATRSGETARALRGLLRGRRLGPARRGGGRSPRTRASCPFRGAYLYLKPGQARAGARA